MEQYNLSKNMRPEEQRQARKDNLVASIEKCLITAMNLLVELEEIDEKNEMMIK